MSTYLELPTYTYDKMSTVEKPVVIRGLYRPQARKLNLKILVSMFGTTKLPVEVYKTRNSDTTSATTREYTLGHLFKHWEKNVPPYLYCAEVNVPEDMVHMLKNPNTIQRCVEELLLFLGNE
jgi:hypothetical protein